MPPLAHRSKFVSDDGLLRFKLDQKFEAVPRELENALVESAIDFFNQIKMAEPVNSDLPFFAYGLFKPGQLGFDSLQEHVFERPTSACMIGNLYERDGVPLFTDGTLEISGALITFKPEHASPAYKTIARLEPEKQYKWETKTTTARG